jgi:predicted nucleotidyltransferase
VKPREKHIFQLITRRIKELDSQAEVILYGSRARGEAGIDSDWDILVLLDQDDVTLKTEQQFRHHLFDIELEIGEPISVFVRSKSIWESKYRITPLYKSVKAEGVKV